MANVSLELFSASDHQIVIPVRSLELSHSPKRDIRWFVYPCTHQPRPRPQLDLHLVLLTFAASLHTARHQQQTWATPTPPPPQAPRSMLPSTRLQQRPRRWGAAASMRALRDGTRSVCLLRDPAQGRRTSAAHAPHLAKITISQLHSIHSCIRMHRHRAAQISTMRARHHHRACWRRQWVAYACGHGS